MISRFPHAIAVALSLLIISTPAWAQSDGKLTGVVRDATSAGLPGAIVAATSQSTRDYRTATTSVDGSYSLSLPPGTYQHLGSRFTQVGDQDLGMLNMLSFGANTSARR